MKAFLIVFLLALLICPQSQCNTPKASQESQTHLFQTIEKKKITDSELEKAIGKLTLPAQESPEFWTKIANDASYSVFHRRYAVVELFRRHVHRGMRLSELARVLHHPTWLRASDIRSLHGVGGLLPFTSRHGMVGGTIFVLGIVPTAQNNSWGIWLLVTGGVHDQSFRDLILGMGKTSIGNETVAEIAYEYPGMPHHAKYDNAGCCGKGSGRN